MNLTDGAIGGLFLTGFFVGVIVVGIAFVAYGLDARSALRREAIERGYGLHCPTDGSFAWKGECPE